MNMRMLINAKIWLGFSLAVFLAPASYAACSYSLTPGGRSHGNGTTNNSFTVNAGTDCSWSVTSNPSWITIQSGASGVSTGTVSYVIEANLDSVGRTGAVVVAGLSFIIEQAGAPCNYDITPNERTGHGSGASGSLQPVSIDVDALNCAWTVINTNPWINFIGATNGVGDGGVNYTLLANRTPVRRTGNVLIAEQTFLVAQAAGSCQYEMHTSGTSVLTNRLHGHAGSSGGVTVSTIPANNGCEWYVVNTNTWITITTNAAGGTNGGTFGYDVAPNPNSTPREGSLTIWNQAIFVVLQHPAPCSNGYSILPSSATPGPEPETNVVQVTTIGGCPWTVVNTNSWITILSPTNNTNNGSVTWAVTLNTSSVGRTGVVVIAEKNFTVRQDGAICSYEISPTSRKHGYNTVTTNKVSIDTLSICPWEVVNTNSWITFYAPTNGVGDSTNITYSLSPNLSSNIRTGLVFIGGQSLVLTQLGINCAINLSPANNPHGHGAATKSISVNTGTNCSWTVNNTNSWIQITTNSSGNGSNSFTYAIAPNPNSSPRTGYISVEESVISVSQAGAPCNVPLTPSFATHTPMQETGTVVVANPGGCDWTATTINPWVSILGGATGTGLGVITYRVDANANGGARSGGITVTGLADTNYFSIDQDGVTCAYRLSPTNRSHGPGGVAVATFKVLVSNACPWVVENNNSWIQITTNASGTGSNQVSYSVEPNSLTPFERIGALVVNGQSLVITQRGITCNYSVSPKTVTHGNGLATNFFTVTTTNGCAWGITNDNSWITITSNSTGTATANVGYRVEANPSAEVRIGTLYVDGQTYVVTQLATACSFSLSPKSVTHGNGTTTNTFNVNTPSGCPWTVTNDNSWITIVSNSTGTATATVGYTVEANPSASMRIGTLFVDGQTYIVTQLAANCSISLSATNRNHGYGATNASVDVDTAAGCDWPVSTPDSWIQILSLVPPTVTGTGTVNYAVLSNPDLTPRVGSIQIGYRTLTINQAAFDCNYKLSPTNRPHGFGATTNSVNVTNVSPGCSWTASTSTEWITLLGTLTGTNNGTVSYSISPNTGTTSRTGTVMVADQVLTLVQGVATNGFLFEAVLPGPNGEIVLKLNGGPPGIWELQSSIDLTTWTKVADITNITGRVQYIVPSAAGTNRFYRAMLP